jgi:hypothetical protein
MSSIEFKIIQTKCGIKNILASFEIDFAQIIVISTITQSSMISINPRNGDFNLKNNNVRKAFRTS